MPFKAKNNREAVVVCAIHVVKRPSKRSVLVNIKIKTNKFPRTVLITFITAQSSQNFTPPLSMSRF